MHEVDEARGLGGVELLDVGFGDLGQSMVQLMEFSGAGHTGFMGEGGVIGFGALIIPVLEVLVHSGLLG